jgi:hypothetical protein
VAESPEIPEAKDPFERRVALTIAILAIVLSLISTLGDNAKLESLLAATKASNSWAYYQSKSIKEHTFSMQQELLQAFNPQAIEEGMRQKLVTRYAGEVNRYGKEKDEIKNTAEEYERAIERNSRINDRCDLAGLLLQIGIVFGSVAILVRWKAMWVVSICLGLAGLLAGLTALLM